MGPLFVCLSVSDAGVLWPNGSIDEDETWQVGRPRPWPHCVRWGPSSPPLKQHSPQFLAIPVVAKGWMDYDATWYEGRPRPRRLCVKCRPSLLQKKRHSPPPNFWPMSIVAKWLDGSRCHLVQR